MRSAHSHLGAAADGDDVERGVEGEGVEAEVLAEEERAAGHHEGRGVLSRAVEGVEEVDEDAGAVGVPEDELPQEVVRVEGDLAGGAAVSVVAEIEARLAPLRDGKIRWMAPASPGNFSARSTCPPGATSLLLARRLWARSTAACRSRRPQPK